MTVDQEKNILFNQEARDKLMVGIDTLANAVKVTLGPKGRNVVIDTKNGLPRTTKDGVTVARHVDLKDKFENMGAKLMIEVAGRQNFKSGDGTTTATLLAQSILNRGMSMSLLNSKTNPIDLKRGIDKASEWIIESLKEYAVPIETSEEIQQVATISANGEQEIGDLIAEAVEKVGRDGVITVDESKSMETSLEVVEGLEFEQGLISPYFISDSARAMSVLKDPYIFIHNKTLNNVAPLMPLLEAVVQSGRSLLIIAPDVEGELLSTLVVNKMQGGMPVAAVRALGHGENKEIFLQDLALITGATMIDQSLGDQLENITLDYLGRASKVESTKNSTVIMGGEGNKEHVQDKINELRKDLEASTSQPERDRIQDRLGRLSGGVAIIHVGGTTEVEVKERKDRVDDAIHATKAAIAEGIVAGGGIALHRASNKNSSKLMDSAENDDEVLGMQILINSVKDPMMQIINNAGKDFDKIVDEVYEHPEVSIGYNAKTDVVEDLVKAGVIDPVKVTRTALENAVSVSGILITTETIIIEKPKEEFLF